MKRGLGFFVAGSILVVAGCSSGGEPQTIVETVYVTPEPTATQESVDVVVPSEPEETAASDQGTEEDVTSCLVITSTPKKKWEDKGKSYQQLWLNMNFAIKNECDKKVKSAKFEWTALDEFGDEWPGGYEFVDAIRTDPGRVWQQTASIGYRHYDSDRNFAVLERLNEDEITPQISNVRVVFSDGTTIGSAD